jgi:bzd-type benzoyl-CoA reductase N subunit
MAHLAALQTLIETARAPLSSWHTRYPGHRAMGYLCSYVPAEIIHAAGYTPVRLRGDNTPLRLVDAHLQSFTCALCRSTLDQSLSGKLAFLEGTVFAHTCDTLQAQADLWRMNSEPDYFVDTVMQPANLGTPAAHPYLAAELSRFRARLAAFAGRSISDEDLQASISIYDVTRQQVQKLQQTRSKLNAVQFFAILDAAQAMPREVFNQHLAQVLAELESLPMRTSGARLVLTGAVLDEPRLLNLIDEADARVVGDDLCSGSRHFIDQVGSDDDPIPALAAYSLRRVPCPTKLHPAHDPGRHLLDLVRQTKADGVIFAVEKFCEPHAFDYALILPTLDRGRVPHLLLEMEHTPSLEALRTRIQAFVEML